MYAGLSPVDPLPGSSRARPPREIFVSVQLHLSKAAAAQRKLTRRKTDKRESLRPATASAADINQKRIKEKSSWLNLAKLNGSAEQWRPATCKLSEEESGCSLNVYIEDSILYQTVHVHKLYHTDVRRIHHSLFERKDCLGIYCIDHLSVHPDPRPSGQAWSPTGSIEPIFLCFPETDLMNTWMALLRSYAIPEVYGRWHSIPDGGLYRMWRQVKLTCLQGRNLGTHRPVPEDPQNSDYDNRQDGDAIDIDVYCEIYVNGYLSGRTTVKKGIGSPDWHESFTFEDLPPFDSLEIVIMREKKLTKPVIVGSVFIYLMNFRRGEFVEGWFPVLAGGGHVDIQAGEMRLKIKVDEEIILPSATYARLVRTLQSRNYLDWLQDFEARLHLKSLSEPIMAVALSRNVLLDNILELADREVDGTPSSHMTLFRGNTVFTKTAERFMALYGASFLEASVGTVIRRLCADKVSIEIDPVRSGRSQRSIGRNVDELVHWCQEFWTSIYDARTQCPMEMRKLFTHIRMLIESRYRPKDDERYRELPWQGVSSFLFLRFLVPAVLNPHLFGILPGLPEEPIARSLKLIAKVLQNLANMNTTVQKEGFMKAVEDFLGRSSDAMVDYILMLSSVEGTPSCPPGKDGREKVRAVRLLQHRTANSPILFREAIPSLPYVLDVPKHLAVVCSVVVRHSRKHGYPMKPNDANDVQFNELCLRCLEVEEQALQREDILTW
ncbi:Rho GTPase activation protein [Panus rudis PR-1116 ss-1]|nr:Rho GTPase activation protein [Panus rudis PR-1116 ss-1]